MKKAPVNSLFSFSSLFFIGFFSFLVVLPASAQSNVTEDNGDFASLAIDRRDGELYGWAIDYTTQEKADVRALEECQKNGGNCHVVLRFKGGCGAYVVERGNSSLYGWGTADSREAAESRALEEARAQGGKDLVVRVWGCNDGELESFEEVASVKGVYSFYMVYSEEEKKCFITPVLFQPDVARKNGDSWVWTEDAQQKMTPRAKKFMDAVEEDLYGYLGDLKEQAITRKKLDWAGKNEVDLTNNTLNLSNVERKSKIEAGIKGIHKMVADQGAELVIVNVD